MKKDKPALESSQQVSSGKYPLELVASLAAKLLQGENYGQAVKRAIALLDETAAVLEGRPDPTPPTAPLLSEPTDMGWEEFVNYLTDGARPERAETKVNDYFKFEIKMRKAGQLAVEKFGTFGRGAWRQFIDQVAETTPEELNARLKDLQKPIEFTHGGTRPAIIARNIVRQHKEQFAEWESLEKSRRALENGAKGGRPKKKPRKR